MNQTEDKARLKRQKTAKAIEFAMASRWDDAITENKSIIASFPGEADAHNRLGKALSETGKIKEARESYSARWRSTRRTRSRGRTWSGCQTLKAKAEPDRAQQVDASLFIEEMGKTGVTTLKPANIKLLATLSAGDEVTLTPVGSRLTVETAASEYIADIEPKLALRLSKLLAGGNKYAAAVAGLGADSVRVIIKETFQDPSQAGRLSFPAGKAGDLVRPYTKESIVRTDGDDDEDVTDEVEDWEDTEDDAADGDDGSQPVRRDRTRRRRRQRLRRVGAR